MAVLNTGLAKTSAGDFTIPYSCRFDGTAYLTRTMATPTSNQKFSFSFWFKRGGITTTAQGTPFGIGSSGSNYAEIHIHGYLDYVSQFEYTGAYHIRNHNGDIKLRDPSAWMHYLIAVDTTQSEEDDRVKIYFNGVLETNWGDDDIPAEDYALGWFNSANEWVVGAQFNYSGGFDGYLAEMHWIDGTQLAPTEFGEFGDYGEWKPIEVTGLTYGTNGFYLDFADSAALGDDESGESNDFAVTNLDASDQMLDTPTNNFATFNPLSGNSQYVETEGNLGIAFYGANWLGTLTSTLGMTSGKWYWEVNILVGNPSSSQRVMLGIANTEHASFASTHIGNTSGSYCLYGLNGEWFSGTSSSSGSYGTYTDGDIMQFAYNADTGTLWIGKDNTWLNSATAGEIEAGTTTNSFVTGLTGTWLAGLTVRDDSSVIANFGQDSSFAGDKTAQGETDSNGIGDFYYEPPADFLALCTSNLPEPAVTPSEHFNTVIYTGTGASQTIRGVGFQPDLLILKVRSTTGNHSSMNAITGAGNTLYTSGDNAEIDYTAYITDFDADGFDTGTEGGVVNYTDYTYVAWNWKAGNATLGTGDFTQGSIASTCSRNVDAGFSIVSYTGTGVAGTVGHGLSLAPELILLKNRESNWDWAVYHANNTSAPETDYLRINTTGGTTDDAGIWNDTAPTADVFSVGTAGTTNDSDDDIIAYCFHSVDGYSKVGSYIGNDDADGTFVYTGFRPAYVLQHVVTGGWGWNVYDNARDSYNQMDKTLQPSTSAAEVTSGGELDFLSNGFKWRDSTDEGVNNGDDDYIYWAFAETPFKYSNAR